MTVAVPTLKSIQNINHENTCKDLKIGSVSNIRFKVPQSLVGKYFQKIIDAEKILDCG